MRFSGKIWFMIILKVTRKQDFILSLENNLLEKPHRRAGGGVRPNQTLLG